MGKKGEGVGVKKKDGREEGRRRAMCYKLYVLIDFD